jgi:hypothetical protein
MEYPKVELEKLSQNKNAPLVVKQNEQDADFIYLELFQIFSETFDLQRNFPNADDALQAAVRGFTNELRTSPYAATVNIKAYVDAKLSSSKVLNSLDVGQHAFAYAQDKLTYVAVQESHTLQDVTPLLHLVLTCTSDYAAKEERLAVTRLFQMRQISRDYHVDFKMYLAMLCGDVVKFLITEVFHTLLFKMPDAAMKDSYLFLSADLCVWTIRTKGYALVFQMKKDFEATLLLEKLPAVSEAMFLGGRI